jgi:hypothetical protein
MMSRFDYDLYAPDEEALQKQWQAEADDLARQGSVDAGPREGGRQ